MAKPKAQPFDVVTNQGLTDKDEKELAGLVQRSHTNEWNACGADFWYWCQFVITEDEDDGKTKPFPVHYEHLRKIDYEIEKVQKAIILKSRRVMVSWLGMLRMLHGAMFAGTNTPDTYDSFRGGVMSVGEIEAMYMIERITKVWRKFPDWMKERNPLLTDNKLLMVFSKDGTIQAFPMKREGAQGFGFTRIFFDEMALQDFARTTWTGVMPTLGQKGKLLAVSTPNGKANFFHDVWSNKRGMYKGMLKIQLHWTGRTVFESEEGQKHFTPKIAPHDQAWYEAVTDGMDKQMVARMFELSFAAYTGDAVFATFERHTHCIPKTEIINARPMLMGWDFGFHYPATTFWQYNTRDQYVGHYEYEEFDAEFGQYCENVKEFASSFCPDNQPMLHFIDPAGMQRYHSRSRTGAMCDRDEIKRVFGQDAQIRLGNNDVGTRDNEGPRLKEVRKLLRLRADGQPGMVVSEAGMPGFIEGMLGAYHYDEKGGEIPIKDETSHKQDTFQMVVTGRGALLTSQATTKRKRRSQRRVGRRTGM